MSDRRCDELFEAMVDSVGVKGFAANMGLSTRQIHRMLNGTQPNPVARMCDTLSSCDCELAGNTLDQMCQQQGG